MQLNKQDWQTVTFGDVVFQGKGTVDPETSGLERYVAGEHMVSDDLHIRQWGIVGEGYLGPAFHRPFEKGDILYGSRRTYLKKVAVAGFDGITSNTTFVVKENLDMVVPGFIPFLMLSDRFTEHSVKNSKGSVNPYINFKDITKFKFLLPPLKLQERLTQLLWAADTAENQYNKLAAYCKMVKTSLLHEVATNSTDLIPLSDIATISYGMGMPPKLSDDGIPIIRATNIFRGKIVDNNVIRAKVEDVPLGKRVLLEEGDILVVRSGAYTGDIGYVSEDWGGSLAGYDLVVKPDREKVEPLLISEFLLAESAQSYFKGESVRSAQPHLNAEQLRNTMVPNISKEQHEAIAKRVLAVSVSLEKCLELAKATRITKQNIMDQLFTA
jgi:type I restriction enzyme S subunit